MGKVDRVQRIKDNLAKIGLQDTRRVIEINEAMTRMSVLGLTCDQVLALVRKAKEAEAAGGEVVYDATGFHGFKNLRQALMAAYSGMAKSDRPASLEDCHKRVEALIKNQAPERGAGGFGLIVSIPGIATAAVQPVAAKKFKRLPSGKLKELPPGGGEPEILDVDIVESTVTYLERKAK